MYAQLLQFDGPRAPELDAAAERAGIERITPAILADPPTAADLVCTYVLRHPDGGQTVLIVANTTQTLDRIHEIVMDTDLLPGEDPALLPDPDRVVRLTVVHAVEHGKVVQP